MCVEFQLTLRHRVVKVKVVAVMVQEGYEDFLGGQFAPFGRGNPVRQQVKGLVCFDIRLQKAHLCLWW